VKIRFDRPWMLPTNRLAWLALCLLAFGLAGCDTGPFERSSDGTTILLDQQGEAAKAAATRNIVQALNRGVDVYQLGIGDEVEIFFHVNRRPTSRQYLIAADDKLRIDFLGDTEHSRTVQVQPDGQVSMPLIGSVTAAGQTPDALARQLEERYRGALTEPKITVNVTETHTPLEDFIKVIAPSGKRSIVDKVLPDGTISLPLLPAIVARGRPLNEVQREIDAGYAAKGLSVFVSLVPRALHSNVALVIGEVSTPGQLELDRPTTVLMAVAQAGGVLKTGSMDAVRLYYIAADGTQRLRSINLTDVIDKLSIEDDMIVPPNSIIYVPPTELAKTGRLLDLVLRDILQFQGTGIGAAFQILAPSAQQNTTIFFPSR
jgi:polysaccharide biosynthesis/export protein PslD